MKAVVVLGVLDLGIGVFTVLVILIIDAQYLKLLARLVPVTLNGKNGGLL